MCRFDDLLLQSVVDEETAMLGYFQEASQLYFETILLKLVPENLKCTYISPPPSLMAVHNCN